MRVQQKQQNRSFVQLNIMVIVGGDIDVQQGAVRVKHRPSWNENSARPPCQGVVPFLKICVCVQRMGSVHMKVQ